LIADEAAISSFVPVSLDDLMLGAELGKRELQRRVFGAKPANNDHEIAQNADQVRG